MGFLRFLMLITTVPVWFYLLLSPFRTFFRIRTENVLMWAWVFIILLPVFSWLLCIFQTLIDTKDWLLYGDVKAWSSSKDISDNVEVIQDTSDRRPKTIRRIVIEEEEHY